MKVRTFNIVFTVLAILFIGYSIVCAVLLSRQDVMLEHMTWYVWVWVAFGFGIMVWMLYYGSKEAKQVYHLDNDLKEYEHYPDYPDDIGDKNRM